MKNRVNKIKKEVEEIRKSGGRFIIREDLDLFPEYAILCGFLLMVLITPSIVLLASGIAYGSKFMIALGSVLTGIFGLGIVSIACLFVYSIAHEQITRLKKSKMRKGSRKIHQQRNLAGGNQITNKRRRKCGKMQK